jgi:PadR family transcriptional regulator PadR
MQRLFLTEFELMVLLAVLRIGEEAYGVPVAQGIEATAGRTVLLGHVYAALERLAARGLVSSTLGEPTPQRGGRAKRYFRVTAAGIRTLRETRHALTALWSRVPGLTGGTT